MTTLSLLVASPFRESSECAGRWLLSYKPAVLFLNLPKELDNSLKTYCKNKITLDEFLRDLALLTGLADPHIAAFEYWWTPLLKAIQKVHVVYEIKVKCYGELNHYIKSKKISEEIFYQSYKAKVSSIDIDKWKTVFQEEYAITKEMAISCIENILGNVKLNRENAVLIRSTLRYISKRAKEKGYTVNHVYLHKYWRPPLAVLQMLFEVYGGHVSETIIEKCVRAHLKYLDFILTRKNLDDAYKSWSTHLNLRKRLTDHLVFQ